MSKLSFSVSLLILLGLFLLGGYLYPQIQAILTPLSKSDADIIRSPEELYFIVTYGHEQIIKKYGVELLIRRDAQPFIVVVNTHAGDVRFWDLREKIFLVDDKGNEYPSIAQHILPGQHHSTWLVQFPKYDHMGNLLFERKEGFIEVIIKGAEPGPNIRRFRFDLPIESSPASPIVSYMLLGAAATAIMMYAVSPCLIANFGVATILLGSSGSRAWRYGNMFAFGIGYMIFVVTGGITLLSIAVRLEEVPIWIRQLEIAGGVPSLLLALYFLGLFDRTPVKRLIMRVGKRLITRLEKYYIRQENERSVGPLESFIIGAALSMGCSACAGVVGLPLLLPLLTFLGIGGYIVIATAFAVVVLGYLVPFILVSRAIQLPISIRRRSLIIRTSRLILAVFLLIIAFLFLGGITHMMINTMWWILGQIYTLVKSLLTPLSL
jgi:hypothetical protein